MYYSIYFIYILILYFLFLQIRLIMGCLLTRGVPAAEKLEEDAAARGGGAQKHAGVAITVKYVNRDVDVSVNPDGTFARGSRLPGTAWAARADKNDPAEIKKKHAHRRIQSVGTAPRARLSERAQASALPWKANVLTPFGPGQVSKIARRADGIAEVTLLKWMLADGAKVRIYSPAFSVRSHHRQLSSIDSWTSSGSNPLVAHS
jgi:hypothetical protein